MVDTNVHFQDVVVWRSSMEGHAFVEPASWTDEYRRIRALFDELLR